MGIASLTLMAFAFMSAPPQAVQARDGPPSGQNDQASSPAIRSGIEAEIGRTLTELHDRMIDLADQLIERVDVPDDREGLLAIQPTRFESAKASQKGAELALQAAEIALTEFEKASKVQEEVQADEELKLAQRELERVRSRPQSKARRLLIEQAKKGANIDVAPLILADMEEKKAELQLRRAETKRDVLLNITKPVRAAELRSAVERERSEELAKRATLSLEGSKLSMGKQIKKAHELAAAAGKARNPHDRQALAALDRAIPVEEQLRTMLEQAAKTGKADDRVRQNVQDLTNQLRALVAQAEIERSAACFDALKAAFSAGGGIKPRLTAVRGRERVPASTVIQGADAANPTALASRIRGKLKTQQNRIIDLASQLKTRVDPTDELADQRVNQEISAKSAQAQFENAKLAREIAEIAVVEYNEGIFVQDRETLKRERTLAQSDRDRQRDRVELLKARLAENKPQAKSSPDDAANESRLNDIVESAQLDLRRAELALADVESKLKILEEYTKPKRQKELQSLVEKAKSEELTKRAECELRQFKVNSLQAAIKARRLSPEERTAREAQERQTRSRIGRSIAFAEQLQSKLDQFTTNGKPDDPLRGELQDLSNQLQVLLDQAEAERSAAQFDALKARIHSAAK